MVVGVDDALLIAAAASVASAGIGYAGMQSANSANANINKSTMEFNWAAQEAAANRNIDAMRETNERSRQDAADQRAWSGDMWQQSAAYNSTEAKISRDWTQYMSNTAYQRAMSDMRNAGLNPILAYQQGGATSPSSSAASSSVPSGAASSASGGGSSPVGAPGTHRMENALGPAISSGMQGARTVMDLKQLAAQTDQTQAQTAYTDAARQQAASQTSLNTAQTVSELRRADLITNQAAESAAMPALRSAQTSAASAQAALAHETQRTERERQPLVRAQTGATIEQGNLSRTENQQRSNYGPPGHVSSTVGGVSTILDNIFRSLR